MKNINKWAIFGLGFVSERHINSIKEIGDELILTCDIDPKKKADFLDWHEAMASDKFKDVDCVAIATPDYLHFPIIKEAVRLGKRVLCEKPLTLTAEQCNELPDNGQVGVILQLRKHENVLQAKNNYSGESGEVWVKVCRESRYWNSWQGKPEQCGGILNNIGIHYLDLLLFVSGLDKFDVIEKFYSKNLAYGKIKLGEAVMNYRFEISDSQEGQDRVLKIGNNEISLSKQRNLAFENWHTRVFQDFKNGVVIPPKEAIKTLRLIEKLK